ncbi:MAG: ComEC family competence protein [Flavobacteriaceae bacterium]|nr:ComEC family competence protein [Flavobacteriaceae bacterium]
MLDLKFLPVHFSLFLMAGIVLGFSFDMSLPVIYLLIFMAYLLLVIFYFKAERSFSFPVYFTMATALLFLLIGVLRVSLQKPKYQKHHYSNSYKPDDVLKLKIDKVLKPSKFYKKYEAKVLRAGAYKTTGRILINIANDSSTKTLQVDEVLYTSHSLNLINKALNPGAFDYQKYLKKKNVHHQIKLKKGDFIQLGLQNKSMKGRAHVIREKVNKALNRYDFSQATLSIINAILLGQRQDMSIELFENYKNAGAVHLLAVSGLHIGIILLFLNFVFRPVEKIKHGRSVKLILMILCLWMYAFLAGLSASVIRAVTMFSAMAIGLVSNRPSGVKNGLFVSMFILLLADPLLLFDVGFQLSYTAVFSIVWLQPVFKKLWQPKYKMIDYFWQLLTVSLAAQLGVLPLSLFYFHQFPGLFFISSLVIIPFLGFILGLGILVIIFALLQILPQLLADFYSLIIKLMNGVVAWVSQQEDFIFQNISFSLFLMIAFYLLLYASEKLINQQSPKNFETFLIVLICLQTGCIVQKYKNHQTKEFIVFHQLKNSLLINMNGHGLFPYSRSDSINPMAKKILNDYILNFTAIEINRAKALKNVMKVHSKTLLIIDSSGVYTGLNIHPETVILTGSPKINMERLISELQPEIIVADGSNFKSFIDLWERTCKNNGINFHNTAVNGAYQYPY